MHRDTEFDENVISVNSLGRDNYNIRVLTPTGDVAELSTVEVLVVRWSGQ